MMLMHHVRSEKTTFCLHSSSWQNILSNNSERYTSHRDVESVKRKVIVQFHFENGKNGRAEARSFAVRVTPSNLERKFVTGIFLFALGRYQQRADDDKDDLRVAYFGWLHVPP